MGFDLRRTDVTDAGGGNAHGDPGIDRAAVGERSPHVRSRAEWAAIDRVIASVASLGVVAPGSWPAVAVQLVLLGDDREEVARLAGLPASASHWDVDPMVARIVEDAGPPPERESACSVLIGLLAQSFRAAPSEREFPMIRTLAALAYGLGSPAVFAEAYGVAEFLDCDCHHPSADGLERRLMEQVEPAVPDALALALTAHARR